MSKKILDGIKVVELSTYIAGPVTARVLGEWGADVVKVEKFNGDPVRNLGMNLMAPIDDDENPVYYFPNASKKSLALNQRSEGGKQVMQKLLDEADVFVTNYRDDALEKMGLTYEALKKRNPKLIFAHVLGYGPKGPEATRPAFDFTTYFARSGFMHAIPDAGGPPSANVPAFGDVQLAICLVAGIAGALFNREKTGEGDYVNASLLHMGVFDLGLLMAAQPYGGDMYPWSREEPLCPTCCTYKCSDGEWYYIGTPDYITYFPPICRVLGLDHLAEDEEYNDIMGMLMHRVEIREWFEEKFMQKTSLEWDKLFRAADIPSERVYKLEDVLHDEQNWANDFIKNVEYANGNKGPIVTTPVRFGSMDTSEIVSLPGAAGCDSDAILKGLGFDESGIAKLKEEGAVNIPE